MALISNSTYKAPFWLSNGHFETIYPALFRSVKIDIPRTSHTIHTQDDDFFDLDLYDINSNKTVIISHGLEGNSQRPYMLGMAHRFLKSGWNAISWNYRGCNGKMNNSIRSYHSGFTDDLAEVIKFALKPQIEQLVLVGFSLGGNITLRYLGGNGQVSDKVKAAVAFSVPVDLHQGCVKISKPSNTIYSKRFLKTLKQKVRDKAIKYPELDLKPLKGIKGLMEFDDLYTAPIHGFKDALDYYTKCSSIHILENIKVPTLIVNALNDPFLPEQCYPYKEVSEHKYVHLETPSRGGHVGFAHHNGSEHYWSENRSLEFVEKMI